MARAPHARTRGRRHAARIMAALGVLALALTGLVPAPAASAEDATDLRVDLPETTSLPVVVAASGEGVLLDVSQGATPRYRATTDDGATFTTPDDRGLTDGRLTTARDGRLVSVVPGDGDGTTSSVYTYDFATGATADPVTVPAADLLTADDRTAVFADDTGAYQAFDLATGEQRALAYAPQLPEEDVAVSLGGGTSALMVQTMSTASGLAATGYLDLVPLDGSAGPGRVAVPGLVSAVIRGDQVVYAQAATTSTGSQSLCFRALGTWLDAPSCRTLKVTGLRDQRYVGVDLAAGPDWALWSISSDAGTASWVVAGTTSAAEPVSVQATEETELSWVGDPGRPVAVVPDGDPGFVGSVADDGFISKRFGFPGTPVVESVLELTPDRVTGLDNRPTVTTEDYQAWQRSVSATEIGEEQTPFPRGLDVGTSGARTLLDDGTKLRLYDRGDYVRSLSPGTYGSLPGLISGPYFPAYALSYQQALSVDGKVLKTATLRGLFGSLVLVRTNAKLGRYDVVDLAGGPSVRVNVPVAYRVQGFSLGGLWGDWAFGYTFDSSGVPWTLAINYRTDEVYSRYGLPVDYGNGFVVVKYADTAEDGSDVLGLEVWNPATGQAETIPDTDWDQVVTDGTARLAYSTSSELVLRTLDVVPTSAPRLLGAFAPASLNLITAARSWPLELDTTKAVEAGTLTITDADGEVVRTLATEAGPDGSVRGVAWDGRDEDGEDVPVGDYTWQLVAAATDGSGNVVGVDGASDLGEEADGTNGVAGTIHVIREYLGTIAGATPTISGTAKVDRTLTARPGTWTPGGTSLSYQWYRTTSKGTTAIDAAVTATYKVTSTDVGARLSVKVTGQLEGWKPTAKTSAKTSTVVKASFTQTPTPTIDDRTPTVGDTVNAFPGTWEPAPVGLSYTWYKVSSSGKSYVLSGSGPSYLVKATDAKYRLKVKVTGTKAGYTTTSRTSKLTSAVAKA